MLFLFLSLSSIYLFWIFYYLHRPPFFLGCCCFRFWLGGLSCLFIFSLSRVRHWRTGSWAEREGERERVSRKKNSLVNYLLILHILSNDTCVCVFLFCFVFRSWAKRDRSSRRQLDNPTWITFLERIFFFFFHKARPKYIFCFFFLIILNIFKNKKK